MTRPTRPTTRHGFSLLEILVVVAIIGILSTLLVIGVDKLVANARRTQTRSALTQCQGLFADWDTVAHQKFPPSAMPSPQNVSNVVNPTPSMGPAQADDATLANRYGAAVWFTRDVMFNLRQTPTNLAALAKVSPGSLMTMPAALNTNFPKPYAASGGDVPVYAAATKYNPFDAQFGRTSIDDGFGNYTYYACIQACQGVSPPSPGYWLAAYPVMKAKGTVPADNSVPVLLDAWGNPIIFVPGGRLGVTPNAANLNMDGTVKLGTGAMRSGTGTGAIATQVSSPDGRPFWASAGPDGDFSTADDNLYSFEK